MSKKLALNKQIWNKLAKKWAVGISPSRPSQEEIAIYENYLQKAILKCNSQMKALILGATPELRDLLAKHRINATLVEINPNMARAMDELLEYSDGKEKVVIANWLNIPIQSNQFDLILCDQGLFHIFFEEWDNFFLEIRRLLKSSGHIIKGIFTIEKSEALNAQEVVRAINNKIISREDKYYYAHRILAGLRDRDGRKYYKYVSDINIEYRKLCKKKRLTEKQYKYLKYPFPYYKFKMVMPPKEIVDDILSRYFIVKSIGVSFANNELTGHKIYFAQNK